MTYSIVAGEVARVDARKVRTLKSTVSSVAVSEDPGTEGASYQVPKVVMWCGGGGDGLGGVDE